MNKNDTEIVLRPELARDLAARYECSAKQEDRIALVFDSAEDCQTFKDKINGANQWVSEIVEIYSEIQAKSSAV